MGKNISKANHKKWFDKNSRRVLVLGTENVGKTSIVSYLYQNNEKVGKPLADIGCYKIKIQSLQIHLYDLKGDA